MFLSTSIPTRVGTKFAEYLEVFHLAKIIIVVVTIKFLWGDSHTFKTLQCNRETLRGLLG